MKRTLDILIFGIIAFMPFVTMAKVGPISLEDLVKGSAYIVVGRVQSVTSVEDVKVAKIEISRTLKGSPVTELYYLAHGTWTCDISDAEVGETALFFFTSYQFDPNPKPRTVLPNGMVLLSSDFKEPLGFRQKLEAMTNGTTFQQVADAGRGKMPLRIIEGENYVTLWSDDVILPDQIKTVAGPEPKYDFIRSASLDQIVAYTEQEILKPQRKKSAPKYRIAYRDRTKTNPSILEVHISIAPKHFNRDDMIALAGLLNKNFSREQRVTVVICDEYETAKDSGIIYDLLRRSPPLALRGFYEIDRLSGKVGISFSTNRGKALDEVDVDLSKKP